MAYDIMGNYSPDYETDEERRRREEQEAATATPVTQTLKTNPVTGEQEMTIKGTPRDLSAANPKTPTVTGPVNPAQVFNRMVQAESGGQQYNPQGGILTSSKGAQGMAQVMPATAANPGYGVTPATAQEIATPEGNRAFGERYFQGLLQHFGGDVQKATAAYNAGPGAVGRNVAANQGQLNTAQLPQETQGYLGKVLGAVGQGVNAIMPSAQAGTVPPAQMQRPATITQTPPTVAQPPQPVAAPVAPDQVAAQPPAPPPVERTATPSMYAPAPTGGPGLTMPGMAANVVPPSSQPQQQEFQTIQDDPAQLMKYAQRDDVPEYLKMRAHDRTYEMLKNNRDEEQAKKDVMNAVQNDPMRIAREMRSKGEEGNWFKAILFSAMGLQGPAMEERAKLGIGNKWEDATLTTPEGTEVGVQLQRRADGKILKGTHADGTPMTAKEVSDAQTGSLGKGVHVTKTETYIEPGNGQVVTHSMLSNGKERYTVGGKLYTGDKASLLPEKQFTAAEDRRVQTAIENLRKNVPQPTAEQTYQALTSARVPNRRIEQEMGLQPGALGAGAGRTAGNAPAAPVRPGATAAAAPAMTPTAAPITAATTATNATPAQTQTALTMNDQPPAEPSIRDIRPGERKDQYEAYVKQVNDTYKKQLEEHQSAIKLKQKDADEFSKKRYEVKSTLDKFREGIDIVKSGNHNLGPNFSVSGAGPLPKVQQFFGEQFGTDDSANTAILRSLISRGGLEGIKNYMGPAISNFDVQSWMKNNPISESSPPAAIEAWLTKTHNAMLDASEAQRTNAVKQGFVEPSFKLGDRIEAAQPQGAGTTSSGNKFKKVQ